MLAQWSLAENVLMASAFGLPPARRDIPSPPFAVPRFRSSKRRSSPLILCLCPKARFSLCKCLRARRLQCCMPWAPGRRRGLRARIRRAPRLYVTWHAYPLARRLHDQGQANYDQMCLKFQAIIKSQRPHPPPSLKPPPLSRANVKETG